MCTESRYTTWPVYRVSVHVVYCIPHEQRHPHTHRYRYAPVFDTVLYRLNDTGFVLLFQKPSKVEMMTSLVRAPTVCRVSSVLDRNRALYGGDNMLTDDHTTCWNSAQGSPQQILLTFHRKVTVEQLQFMFQGGFVGQDVEVFAKRATTPLPVADEAPRGNQQQQQQQQQQQPAAWYQVHDLPDLEDSNNLQQVPCHARDIDALRICFPRRTDFYGRVILYRLDVLGQEPSE